MQGLQDDNSQDSREGKPAFANLHTKRFPFSKEGTGTHLEAGLVVNQCNFPASPRAC